MTKHLRLLVVAVTTLAVGLWFVANSRFLSAADDDDQDVRGTIKKMAAAIEKKDMSTAKKLAGSIPKDVDLEDVMNVMALRTSKSKKKGKGFGIGAKPGTIMPDGIEAKIEDLATKRALSQQVLSKQADALAQAAYVAAAVGQAVQDKPPDQDNDGKPANPKEWKKWAQEMSQLALQFAEACKSKKPMTVKAAASKLNDACIRCHDKYR